MARKEHEKLTVKDLKKAAGPCVTSLEAVLPQYQIKRQAYHSGAFVGNHIHRALKPDVIAALTSVPLTVVQSRTPADSGEVQLLAQAKSLRDRYSRLFTEYAACCKLFSGKLVFTTATRQVLGDAIHTFMATCRAEVLARKLGNVTPKLHLLECHVLPCTGLKLILADLFGHTL